MNFLHEVYLPEAQKRVAHLRKIIAGRPVAILAAGPSIQELEKRIEQLRNKDICYFGINKFFVQETHILHKINKQMSVVSLSGREGMAAAINPIIDFLNRDDDNMFISSFYGDAFGLLGTDFNLSQFLNKHDKKLLFFSLGSPKNLPSDEQPLHFLKSNTLLLLIQLALIGKAESIILFGADGHGGQGSDKYYYRQNEYSIKGWSGVNESLMNDTRHFFNNIASIAIKNTCKTYGLNLVNILNCSTDSYYTPFQKISYDDAIEYLANGKRLFKSLDLRIPVQPKKQNHYSLTVQRALSFCKKHGKKFFKECYATKST